MPSSGHLPPFLGDLCDLKTGFCAYRSDQSERYIVSRNAIMAEQYSQTLISRDKDFVPSSAKVRAFLSTIVDLGVVPAKPSFTLRTPSGKTRYYTNPFTGERDVRETKDHKELRTLDQFEKAAVSLPDYDIEVSGMGRPKLPPVAIDFTEPYFVGVTCFVSSALRSTSDFHEESAAKKDVVSYGELCTAPAITGVFSNPCNLEVIEVPDAGSARFWVQFEFGKFLFPKIADGNLELLDPTIVEAAATIFGVPFIQGCYWG